MNDKNICAISMKYSMRTSNDRSSDKEASDTNIASISKGEAGSCSDARVMYVPRAAAAHRRRRAGGGGGARGVARRSRRVRGRRRRARGA